LPNRGEANFTQADLLPIKAYSEALNLSFHAAALFEGVGQGLLSFFDTNKSISIVLAGVFYWKTMENYLSIIHRRP
jgi:hypothetical protein